MAANTKIEWADHTFNPWIGCTKVSPACDACYAEAWSKRYGRAAWGLGEPRQRTSAATWRAPLRWNEGAKRSGQPKFVFCASLADVFDNEIPPQWRADLFDLITATPSLVWLLLTKRIGNVEKRCPPVAEWPANAWLGATVCNQQEADRDIPKLLTAKYTLGVQRVFLSCEPMLWPIDLTRIPMSAQINDGDVFRDADVNCLNGLMLVYRPGIDALVRSPCTIDWVICGGESGPNARPMHPDWARALRDQCAAAGVPFFFKQWGEWIGGEVYSIGSSQGHARHQDAAQSQLGGLPSHWWSGDVAGGVISTKVGKARAGRLLDGVEHNARPPFAHLANPEAAR